MAAFGTFSSKYISHFSSSLDRFLLETSSSRNLFDNDAQGIKTIGKYITEGDIYDSFSRVYITEGELQMSTASIH